MPIYICKNCGNLTETDEKENLFCATCGAPLADSQPEKKAASDLASTQEKEESHPIPAPSIAEEPAEPKSEQAPTPLDAAPAQETTLAGSDEPEVPPQSAAPPPTPQSSRSQQTPVPLGVPDRPPSIPTTSAESTPPGTSSPQEATTGAPGIIEVYEDKTLVVCPECSYGCAPTWSKCPICGTEIAGAENLQNIAEADLKFDEESLKDDLIPCPKCEYACQKSWDTCPICQTKLNQSE
jgi:DNA-directed RNA polymerase subunit RPC12/RpoP